MKTFAEKFQQNDIIDIKFISPKSLTRVGAHLYRPDYIPEEDGYYDDGESANHYLGYIIDGSLRCRVVGTDTSDNSVMVDPLDVDAGNTDRFWIYGSVVRFAKLIERMRRVVVPSLGDEDYALKFMGEYLHVGCKKITKEDARTIHAAIGEWLEEEKNES